MLKRPGQIWLLYLGCLAVVLPPMAWFTCQVVELDRARAESQVQTELARRQAESARREAEHQRRVSSALWRMDSLLTPLIAQEAARPYFVYEPFLVPAAAMGRRIEGDRVPSPLLVEPNEYVRLHFQLAVDNRWTSPQAPPESLRTAAMAHGVTSERIAAAHARLEQLQGPAFEDLASHLSHDLLPSLAFHDTFASNTIGVERNQGHVFVGDKTFDADQGLANAVGDDSPSTVQHEPPGVEFLRRKQALQNYAQSQVVQQRAGPLVPEETFRLVREGVSRPFWFNDKLLLARRVHKDDEERIQGCWLDWSRLEQALVREVSDLLPEMELVPIVDDRQVEPGRLLASLPVHVQAPLDLASLLASEPAGGSGGWSPMRIALVVAWLCAALAMVAVAVLLHGIMALSERRATFVSAVTHELRTPLTTFRIYSEMLAGNMVPDEASRQSYLKTLHNEAERLGHLVENVLQFSRLERGSGPHPPQVSDVPTLDAKCRERLLARAEQSGMRLIVSFDPQAAAAHVQANPSAIEQILFNLVDNACKYANTATDRRIHLEWRADRRFVMVRVADHGSGISPAVAAKLFRPFSRSPDEAAGSAPGVGLGLALCRRLAHEQSGSLQLESSGNDGAAFLLRLRRARGATVGATHKRKMTT